MEEFKRRTLINAGVIAGTFAVAAALFFLLISITSGQSAAIVKDRSTLAERSYALDNLSSLKANAPQSQAYMQQIAALLPNQDGLLPLPQFLDTTSRTFNVGLTFSYSGAPVSAQGGQPGYIPFSITLSGQPSDIRNFINNLEALTTRFLINFDSVDISASGQNVYGATVTGRVFFQ